LSKIEYDAVNKSGITNVYVIDPEPKPVEEVEKNI
jgi:hypothetical protein